MDSYIFSITKIVTFLDSACSNLDTLLMYVQFHKNLYLVAMVTSFGKYCHRKKWQQTFFRILKSLAFEKYIVFTMIYLWIEIITIIQGPALFNDWWKCIHKKSTNIIEFYILAIKTLCPEKVMFNQFILSYVVMIKIFVPNY